MIIRVCHRCREDVTEGENYNAQCRVKAFEKEHKTHPLSTENILALPGYTNENHKYDLLINQC